MASDDDGAACGISGSEEWGYLSGNGLLTAIYIHMKESKLRWATLTSKMKRLKNVATEMALHVLAYNMIRVMNILGVPALIKAMRA